MLQGQGGMGAGQVRQQLDGRHIPKHLVDNHPNPPMMKIAFSQHTDLNIKFQSHRSRRAACLGLLALTAAAATKDNRAADSVGSACS